jgi:indole-3-glycerol phosphate synthase
MLYKEFVLDPRQIFHAEALGASAVLLIVAALGDAELKKYIRLTEASGMTPLVEVHTEEEMQRAVASGAECIGINNRNLKTFEVSLDTTLSLMRDVPAERLLVCESGIHTRDDVLRMGAAGVNAFLVGEAFMRAAEPGEALAALFG